MRRFAAIALPILVVLTLVLWRKEGPAPKAASAPPDEFSSMRAMTVLREVLAEPAPHPIGSAANMRVRDRIVGRFRALGYETSVQRRFACNTLPVCGTAENILARTPGSNGGAVVLTAHYDSVGAAPGASDDGAGVAALLEIARAIRNEKHRNPIAFLVTDGEESGLLGAQAFIDDATLSREMSVVINVENRGTYGPSNMFETSRGNRWLISHLARSVKRPHATSFFYTIYNLLPNDTDVTVFKHSGKAAVNFAAIGGVSWYHTPLDDLAHVNARTLQHQGDNLLATARELANADLDARSSDDATYFDVLQFHLIWWPAGATIWVAVVSLVLLLAAARRTNPRGMTFGVLMTFMAILLSLFAGVAVSWLTRLRSADVNWVAYPLPSILAMVFTGIACAVFAAAIFRKRSDERALLFGAAIVWHAIAFVLAMTLTGVSFFYLVPAMAITICALARANETMISAVSSTVASIVFLPLIVLLYDGLGGRGLMAIAIFAGTLSTLIAPLFARWRAAATAVALALVCAGIALVLPQSTQERPRALSLAYLDDATRTPAWVAPSLTPELQQAARFTKADTSMTPWARGTQWSAPAPQLALPRVEATATRAGDRVTVIARTRRHADRLALAVRGGTVLSVNGVAPSRMPSRVFRSSNDWRFAVGEGMDEMRVEISAPGPADIIVSDVTYGFPAEGATLLRARDASNAVPQQEGDVTITRVRMRK